jgi:2-iminobutanoate/2-iminopropanoate deaminase
MIRQVIHTENAPKALGPYSQAIVANGFVFLAGQLGTNPATGKLVEGSVKEQARQALTNIGHVLKAAGSSVEYVVKATVFLHNLNDFQDMNEVYAEFFPAVPPARSTVGNLNLPNGALVEIEVVALIVP